MDLSKVKLSKSLLVLGLIEKYGKMKKGKSEKKKRKKEKKEGGGEKKGKKKGKKEHAAGAEGQEKEASGLPALMKKIKVSS